MGGNVIAVEEVPPEETHQYGVVAKGREFGPSFEITGMVEKPAKGTAPSNFIISGRYILQPEIFDMLAKGQKGAGGEIQLTDSMMRTGQTTQKFFAPRISTARPMTPARKSAFSPPMSPSLWRGPTSSRDSAPN